VNLSANPPSKTASADQDLAEQARPGHGIPSQDPDAAAQLPLEGGEAEREANSVLTGGGVIVGVAAGAAIGTVVAGPVGAVVGGAVGAVAGALGGAAASPLLGAEETVAIDRLPREAPASSR
jgi:hypothetical protein